MIRKSEDFNLACRTDGLFKKFAGREKREWYSRTHKITQWTTYISRLFCRLIDINQAHFQYDMMANAGIFEWLENVLVIDTGKTPFIWFLHMIVQENKQMLATKRWYNATCFVTARRSAQNIYRHITNADAINELRCSKLVARCAYVDLIVRTLPEKDKININ